MRSEYVLPELVLIVAAYPDMLPRAIFDSSAGRKDRKRVMGVCSRGRKIEAPNAGQILDVRTDVAISIPGVD